MTQIETTLKLDTLANDGLAEGRFEDFPLKVPGALPGETVRVQIDTSTKPYRAHLLEVLEPSYARGDVECPHMRKTPACGGCPWAMMNPPHQAVVKEQTTLKELAQVGIKVPIVEDFIGTTERKGYRSKAHFIPIFDEGQWHWGMYAAGSHEKVITEPCRAIPDWMNAVAKAVAQALENLDLLPYDETTGKGMVRGLLMREGEDRAGDKMGMVTLILRESPQSLVLFTPLLKELLDMGVATVTLNIHPERGNALLGQEDIVLTEDSSAIETTIHGLSFLVGPQTFLQIHRSQMLKLYEVVLDWAQVTPEDRFMDLYAGIGTMTLLGAQKAKTALGIEYVKESVEAAKLNAQRNGITNTRFIAGAVEAVLPKLIVQGERIDVAIADPAFKGMDRLVPGMIKALGVKRLVYVSCNPKTFARDARALVDLGYTLEKIVTLDLFPDTPHVESVGLFRRA